MMTTEQPRATVSQINGMMEQAWQKIKAIDPCSFDEVRDVCEDVALEWGFDDDAGHLLMTLQVMGWVKECGEDDDRMVAARSIHDV